MSIHRYYLCLSQLKWRYFTPHRSILANILTNSAYPFLSSVGHQEHMINVDTVSGDWPIRRLRRLSVVQCPKCSLWTTFGFICIYKYIHTHICTHIWDVWRMRWLWLFVLFLIELMVRRYVIYFWMTLRLPLSDAVTRTHTQTGPHPARSGLNWLKLDTSWDPANR